MPHIVYVDLSAKIEQWPNDSAVAVSNDASRAILAPSKVKQQARRWLSARYGGKSTQYRVLAVLIYLAVKDDLANIQQIVIDQDYSGHQVEATIKNLLLHLLRRDRPNVKAGFIRFENVKGSRADRLARQVYRGKAKPDKVIQWGEVERILGK